ncbi:unnamed protein product [Photorhabdus laumondii subsp. laumondii TTO1]|uniref:Photorhabdus luminescens subsp. laumondii TTO1 complete genome segment 9/17 n=1 Tax=Photorhabdus laumondii subsp. laumondii (strain DSM 15139 / CIP 105565 / TT01) TaxID=243265 RepID=Q7N417_PHOLL|nr:unnamed protein product [Photorhabdus laumondii subsp. laumondii TTO1]
MAFFRFKGHLCKYFQRGKRAEIFCLTEISLCIRIEDNLNEVLNKHLRLLGTRNDDDSKVVRPDGSSGRVDLMLSKSKGWLSHHSQRKLFEHGK